MLIELRQFGELVFLLRNLFFVPLLPKVLVVLLDPNDSLHARPTTTLRHTEFGKDSLRVVGILKFASSPTLLQTRL